MLGLERDRVEDRPIGNTAESNMAADTNRRVVGVKRVSYLTRRWSCQPPV